MLRDTRQKRLLSVYMGDCQNYGPFLGPYYNTGPNLGDLNRDHNFDSPPYPSEESPSRTRFPSSIQDIQEGTGLVKVS